MYAPMPIYSDYDPFARVYNQHWGDDFTPRVFPIIEQLMLRQLPSGASVLDLCCGTGQMARTLTALGYRVTGLDGSAEMLRFARENAPGATFVHADARSFELTEDFHAVLCTFDSLNHIMVLKELTDVFRNVNAVLRKDGPFFFDMNMEPGFSITWHDNFGIVEDDHICIVRTSYSPEERTARFDTTIMLLENGWQRNDVTLLQKCYSAPEILEALAAGGFTAVESYCLNEREGLTSLTDEAERAFFLCRKSQ